MQPAELYNQKKQRLEQILALTRQLAVVLEQDEPDQLAELLAARQRLMDQVDRLDRDISLLAGVSGNPLPAETPAHINSLLQQIIELDEANKTRLVRELTVVRQKLKELSGGKAVRQAYGMAPVPGSCGCFIDKKK
ncbi:flagellar protein FliT [Desulforamulus hydrothermalis]|uniref:Flagellar protein FliT n=1 Tax=Desulforamulus hydrothermalis Lam5 = DSM 18033 TaxID=1121428 RepID=K8E0T2_9FIRM|nr:flagellar protein FliT [Desulforamulus hydrothermalis]CCO09155.1 conserved hypothetical protein [Desulforamulus hydrothermalis Lam5 = DSM 18033]SHH11561.1 protein FliT [Desulforamulus hydrothermalis Lam5 = DSM 18033]